MNGKPVGNELFVGFSCSGPLLQLAELLWGRGKWT